MNMKPIPAGYQLIDMGGKDITPAAGVTVPGVYNSVQRSNGKLIILYNVVLGTTVYPNSIAAVYNGTSIVLPGLGSFTVDEADLVKYTAGE